MPDGSLSSTEVQRSGRGSGGITGSGFRPGRSGNPSGRPKGIEARAREYTDRALETLVQALDDPDRRVAITAAGILLDRGWGKPKQTVAGDAENPVSYVVRMPEPCASTEEWMERYAKPELARQERIRAIEGKATAPELPAQEPPEPEPAKSTALATAEWLAEFNHSGRDYR